MADSTTYMTVNGPKTVDQMNTELKNAGWQGPPAGTEGAGSTANAYAQTTGGAVTEMAGQTYGGASQNLTQTQGGTQPSSGSTTPAAPINNNGSLDLLKQFAAQTSGVTQAQLAQQKAEFDAQMAFQEKQMQDLGIPQLQINQYLAQLQQQQFQAQVAQTQAQLTGYYSQPQFAALNLSNPLATGTTSTGATGTGGTTGTTGADQQQQYLSARTAQLQQVAGMSAQQAAQTAQAEWSQGYAQSGNVAYGLPQGYASTAAATTAARPSADQYVAARAAQLQQMAGMSAQQATQTAQAEWAQGYAQSGNVAYGEPQGISFTTPTGTAGGTTGGATTSTTGPGQPAGSQQTLALGQLLGTFNGQQTEAASEYARSLAEQIRQYNANLAEQQRQYNATLALQQGQLGQQYLSTASQLQGPQNTFQLSNYLRGAQANTAVPTYLQSLANNLGLPAFQAPGSTAPTPASASGLASQLGGTSSATPGWDYNQTLGTIGNIMSGGAQNLAPGSLERLSPDELQALGSGLGALGGTLPSFLQQYQASRVGQTAPTGVTRLA